LYHYHLGTAKLFHIKVKG